MASRSRAISCINIFNQRVTQPLIPQQLSDWGIAIFSGQISRILIEDKEDFHTEKDELLTAGINHSAFIHVDDTGSRHDGKNGYCTQIGNEAFAWFSSTASKSRINFLELLRGPAVDYTLNAAALEYMRTQKLPQEPLAAIAHCEGQIFEDEAAWKKQLQRLKITKKRHIRIATEGALLGTLVACGFPPDLVIISDDAGQFNVLLHALCWVRYLAYCFMWSHGLARWNWRYAGAIMRWQPGVRTIQSEPYISSPDWTRTRR